jgi:single-stranded-DNA-specific exonuclease
LENRGIDSKNKEDIESFLHPDYSKVYDPFLFEQMSIATERVWRAIEDKENIYIYSDYDADAITASAVVYRGLSALGVTPGIYIPDRFSEGYGLNLAAFEKIKADGATVVITVDCGTNSVEEAKFCKENGIDLIITDHHEVTAELPDAYALINPKRPGEKYPYHELTGVGVAYKFIAALYSDRAHNQLSEGYEKWLLDLVAIGTVADCHSLLGENRILVSYGIQVLRKTRWPGLRTLLQLAGVESKDIVARTLGFVLAPRINAAGRLEHASGAFDLLIADDIAQSSVLASALDAVNKKRQLLTETVMSEAKAQIELISDRKILLVAGTDWPKGVVGLVAGKLAEEYQRPVLVMDKGDEFCTGSARSTPDFNIVDALIYSKDYLVKFGGHAAAAGFTLRTEYLDKFYDQLLKFQELQKSELDDSNKEESQEKFFEAEAEVFPEELTLQVAKDIESLEPFGQDNNRPRLVIRNVLLEKINAVGKDKQHIQLSINAGGKSIKGIAFSAIRMFQPFKLGDQVDLFFETMVDSWQDMESLKVRVIDIKPALSS